MSQDGSLGVDRVVIATHADQALGLLADPSDAEVTTLKQFGYCGQRDGSAHRQTRSCRRRAMPVRHGTTG